MTTHRRRWIAPVLVVLQLAAAIPAFLSGLIAPPAGVLVMKVIWVGFCVLAFLVYRRNPPLALAVPGIAVLTGVLCLVLGGAFLGWEG